MPNFKQNKQTTIIYLLCLSYPLPSASLFDKLPSPHYTQDKFNQLQNQKFSPSKSINLKHPRKPCSGRNWTCLPPFMIKFLHCLHSFQTKIHSFHNDTSPLHCLMVWHYYQSCLMSDLLLFPHSKYHVIHKLLLHTSLSAVKKNKQ